MTTEEKIIAILKELKSVALETKQTVENIIENAKSKTDQLESELFSIDQNLAASAYENNAEIRKLMSEIKNLTV